VNGTEEKHITGQVLALPRIATGTTSQPLNMAYQLTLLLFFALTRNFLTVRESKRKLNALEVSHGGVVRD
jgi:hypothetical protein